MLVVVGTVPTATCLHCRTVGTGALAANTPWPLLAAAVAVVVGACLWGLFRRGSIADRARTDPVQDRAEGVPNDES